jgi:hypothetical protein
VIYIVTRGDYEDFHNVAAYSDKAIADRHAEVILGEVECWPLDVPLKFPANLLPWVVIIDEEGSVDSVKRFAFGGELPGWDFYRISRPPLAAFYLWAPDERHAVKFADERRAFLVAGGEWTKKYEKKRSSGIQSISVKIG